jgi:hypothetical protein
MQKAKKKNANAGDRTTYQRPDTRIVRIPLDDKIARPLVGPGRHDHDIASLRVLGTDDRFLVCWAETAVEDLHVVAVQMDLRQR